MDSRARRNGSKLDGSQIDDNEVSGGKVNDEVGNKDQKTSKSKKLSKYKKTVGSSDFLTPRARLAFNKLRQVFVKAWILQHFNPERYIRFETNVLEYTIDRVLSQLISDNLGRWHPIVFFS